MSDGEARAYIRGAFELRGLPAPTLAELQGIGAIGRFEGNYGAAFGDANNWGAVQCKARQPCPAGCTPVTDRDANGVAYAACFRVYETPAHGAADMLREVYRRPGVPEAMRAGNASLVAERMRAGRYFEAPARLYARGIVGNAKSIAASLKEKLAIDLHGVDSAPPPETPDERAPGESSGTAALPELVGLLGFLLALKTLKVQGRKSIGGKR